MARDVTPPPPAGVKSFTQYHWSDYWPSVQVLLKTWAGLVHLHLMFFKRVCLLASLHHLSLSL